LFEMCVHVIEMTLTFLRPFLTLGVSEGVNIPSREQSSPLGSKFTPGVLTPRGKLHPWWQTKSLKTGLRHPRPGPEAIMLSLTKLT
jgi:hypothetical protein